MPFGESAGTHVSGESSASSTVPLEFRTSLTAECSRGDGSKNQRVSDFLSARELRNETTTGRIGTDEERSMPNQPIRGKGSMARDGRHNPRELAVDFAVNLSLE